MAGVSQNGGKKWFPLATESVSTSRNKVIFQKLDLPVSTNGKRISNYKNIVSNTQKVGFQYGNGEFV